MTRSIVRLSRSSSVLLVMALPPEAASGTASACAPPETPSAWPRSCAGSRPPRFLRSRALRCAGGRRRAAHWVTAGRAPGRHRPRPRGLGREPREKVGARAGPPPRNRRRRPPPQPIRRLRRRRRSIEQLVAMR